MKKMIACFLLCALVFAPVTAGAAESDWDMSVPTEITEEIQELFDDSVEKIVGAGYTPVAVLGVCDDTWCILCKGKGVYPYAKPYNALVYIDGSEKKVTNIYDLWLDAHSGKGNGNVENVLDGADAEIVLDPIAAEDIYETADSVVMPMDSLRLTEEITPEDISKTMGYIEKTKKGEMKKREPFSVVERGDGTYSIIDGNKSYSALKELGAKSVPVIVADRPYNKDVESFDDLISLYSEAETEFHQTVTSLGEEWKAEVSEHSDLKDADTIHQKAKENYDGDYGRVVDVLSADMRVPAEELQAAAQKLLEKDDVLCLYNHENDNGYTAYIRLSNGAIVEIQLEEAK